MSSPSDRAAPAELTPRLPLWRNPRVLIAAAAVAFALIGFAWTLGGYFVGDDFGYVGRFYNYPLLQWPRLFANSWAGDLWGFELRELRPMSALSFMIDGRLWGGNAFGFRLTNLLLHMCSTTMVGLLAWRAAGRELLCGLAAVALFALHPVHAEAVHWVTGRVDVQTTTLYLAGVCCFLRYRDTNKGSWAVAVAACYFAAAFGKEFGLTLPLMLFAADLLWPSAGRRWGQAQTWLPYALCVGVVVIYYFCRHAAFGASAGAAPPDLKSALFYAQLSQRQLAYLGNLFPGFERWLGEGSPVLTGHVVRTFSWIVAGVVVVFAAVRWGAVWRARDERSAGLLFGLGWYAVATLPLIVTYISARHLYLASVGVCIALVLVLRALLVSRWLFAVAGAALAVFFGLRLPAAMRPWDQAARISGDACRELRRLEPELQPGSVLLLDVPEMMHGAYVWTWAVPSVLHPPFTSRRLDEGVIVMESRGNYIDWDRWHEQPAVAALAHVEKPSWLIRITETQPVRRLSVDPAKLRLAAEDFAKAPLKESPHPYWAKFLREASPP